MIEYVWRHGGTFQEWSEHFSIDLWLEALAANGLDVEWYVYRHRTEDEVLPWDHLSAGLHKDFLWQDWRDALEELGLEDCRWTPCYDCGACTGYGIEHVVASATPPAGGSQGTGVDLAVGAVRSTAARPASRCLVNGGKPQVRLGFSKHGKIRFTSIATWLAFGNVRCSPDQLPIAYSEGFTPRPKLSFGLALSTGHESEGEYLDVDLDPEQGADLDLAGLTSHLSAQLPVGMTATGVVVVDRRMPSLQQAVTSCTWQIDVRDVDESTAQAAIDAALAADELMITRERKGKEVTDDIRPLVFGLAVDQPTENGVRLIAELGTQPRAVRVTELLSALDPPLAEPLLNEPRVLRVHQWITTDDGERHDPMSVAAAASAPVGVA